MEESGPRVGVAFQRLVRPHQPRLLIISNLGRNLCRCYWHFISLSGGIPTCVSALSTRQTWPADCIKLKTALCRRLQHRGVHNYFPAQEIWNMLNNENKLFPDIAFDTTFNSLQKHQFEMCRTTHYAPWLAFEIGRHCKCICCGAYQFHVKAPIAVPWSALQHSYHDVFPILYWNFL